MSGTSRYGVPAFDRPHKMICGVCATLAVLAGLPVWIVRVVAAVLLVVHGCIALPLYLLSAFIWRRNIRAVLAGGAWTGNPASPYGWGDDRWSGRGF